MTTRYRREATTNRLKKVCGRCIWMLPSRSRVDVGTCPPCQQQRKGWKNMPSCPTCGYLHNSGKQAVHFRLEREIGAVELVMPQWSYCMEYKFQVRKDAIKLTRSRGLPIGRALWTVYKNEQHRMERLLLTIANASSASSSSPALASKVNKLEQQVANIVRDRSGTPRQGNGQRQATNLSPFNTQCTLNLPSRISHSRRKAKAKARKGKERKEKAK